MSAIVITQALPSERNRLLKQKNDSESEDDDDDDDERPTSASHGYGAVARSDTERSGVSVVAHGGDRTAAVDENAENIPLKYSISKLRFVVVW